MKGRWWHPLPDGRIQCDLCPRDCKLHEGQRGLCFVRQMEGGEMHLTTYGRSSGFCVDPVEKKPLNHFYPGSSILSFGTAGCNLTCKFCQNWDISKSKEMDRLQDEAAPELIARSAQKLGCKSVAFTYNDPVIFAEYAMDVADACHALAVHMAVEEGVFYPAVRDAVEDDDLMNEALVEHDGAKSLIQDLEGMDAGDEMFNAKFTLLAASVRYHVKEERDEIFPRVRATSIDLKALGQKMLARREQLKKSNGAVPKSRPLRRKSHAKGEPRASS